ncbi:MAG: cation diffusion facilitator family transporter [Patescibacteria group bacterium]|jgi:cation diffusion facilitator family transporter
MHEHLQNKKKSVALSSVFASFFLTGMKLVVGLLTGSLGILSEAAHSALDFGAALLTYFAVRVGDKPADSRHPYGHAKVESVSALIETGLLFLTSAWIIYEATKRLFFKSVEVETTWYAIVIIIISIVIDISRSRALKRIGKQTKSQALEADALHFSSDIFSSLAVLIGLILVYFDIGIADPIAALIVAVLVISAGYKLGKRTIDVLIDAAPEGLSEKIHEILKNKEEVISVETVRVRPAGPSVFVEIKINVSRKLALVNVQNISADIEKSVKKIIPEAEISVTAVPLSIDSETIMERVQIAAAHHHLYVHDIVTYEQKGKKFLNYDLEVDDALSIKEAHKIATHLEETIQKELGVKIEINTHIEPVKSEIISSEVISPNEEKETIAKIKSIAKKFPELHGVHNIKLKKNRNKIFVTLHCDFAPNTSLSETHRVASKLEYFIREQIPQVERAVIHAEAA